MASTRIKTNDDVYKALNIYWSGDPTIVIMGGLEAAARREREEQAKQKEVKEVKVVGTDRTKRRFDFEE